MEFRCNAAPNAAPCVHIATTNDKGELLAKPKRVTKVIRNGFSAYSWIDRCSRKHFTAVDAEAKKLNADDYKAMLVECAELGIDVPPGTPFSVLADSLAQIEYDDKQTQAAARPVLLTVPKGRDKHIKEPVNAREAEALSDASEIVELKKWLDDNKVSYQPNTGIKKLRQYKADKEEELTAPDGDAGSGTGEADKEE